MNAPKPTANSEDNTKAKQFVRRPLTPAQKCSSMTSLPSSSSNSRRNFVSAISSSKPPSLSSSVHMQHDDDDELLAPDTPVSYYLEKELAYKKLNEELEKRSTEIFEKIEQYSDRSRSRKNCLSEAGDAPLGESEYKFPEEEDPYSGLSSCNPYASCFNSSRVSTAKSGKTLYRSEGSIDSVSSSKASTIKSQRISPSDGQSVESVDLKARSRLQKATESVVKCLQSKLISYEGRLTDLHLQFRQKIQENTMLESKVRVLEEDRERLIRSISNLQTSVDKHSKAADNAKNNLCLKMQAFTALKKDIDTLKREQKQKAATIQNLQTRLNRTLEENDRLKTQTRSTQMNMRDKQHEDKAVIDELQQRLCQLEQQKNILNATIGKQTALIKTLRNQKVLFLQSFHDHKIPVPSQMSQMLDDSSNCSDDDFNEYLSLKSDNP